MSNSASTSGMTSGMTPGKKLAKEVLQFMQQQNRPFGLTDIHSRMGKSTGKTAVQKALDKLVSKGRLLEKPYNKQRIYMAVEAASETSTSQEDRGLDERIRNLKKAIKEKQEKIAEIRGKLPKDSHRPSLAEATERQDRVKKNIEALQQQIDAAKTNKNSVDPKERAKIEKSFEKNLKEYRKRKRICTDIIDAIMESYPKSKKQLIEDIGIETDEAVNFKYVE